MKTKNNIVKVTEKSLKDKIDDAIRLLGEKQEKVKEQKEESIEGKEIWSNNAKQAEDMLKNGISNNREVVELLLEQAVGYETLFASKLEELNDVETKISSSITQFEKAHKALIIHERSSESQDRIRIFNASVAKQNALVSVSGGNGSFHGNIGETVAMEEQETQSLDDAERQAQELLYSVQAFLELK